MSPRAVEHVRVRARHPAEPPRQLVGRVLLQPLEIGAPSFCSVTAGSTSPEAIIRSTSAFTVRANSSPGVTCRTSLTSHCGTPVAAEVGRDLVFHQRRVPLVGQDGRPQQPQPLPRVDEHRRVRVRDSPAYPPSGTARSTCARPSAAARRVPTTSSAVRSPEPWNQHDEQIAALAVRRPSSRGCASARGGRRAPRSGNGRSRSVCGKDP